MKRKPIMTICAAILLIAALSVSAFAATSTQMQAIQQPVTHSMKAMSRLPRKRPAEEDRQAIIVPVVPGLLQIPPEARPVHPAPVMASRTQ